MKVRGEQLKLKEKKNIKIINDQIIYPFIGKKKLLNYYLSKSNSRKNNFHFIFFTAQTFSRIQFHTK